MNNYDGCYTQHHAIDTKGRKYKLYEVDRREQGADPCKGCAFYFWSSDRMDICLKAERGFKNLCKNTCRTIGDKRFIYKLVCDTRSIS